MIPLYDLNRHGRELSLTPYALGLITAVSREGPARMTGPHGVGRDAKNVYEEFGRLAWLGLVCFKQAG